MASWLTGPQSDGKLLGRACPTYLPQGKRHGTTGELKDAIISEWELLEHEFKSKTTQYLLELVESVPNRVYDVISLKGATTKYETVFFWVAVF
uniref:Uncharacterized protein n=1 Tax=Caenorhabditis japonica TaxID=281687 RepID=A0A8R1EJ76_CAEJA